MKIIRRFPLLLAVLVLASGLSVGCESQTDKEFKQFREGLVRLRQMKMSQVDQVNGELISLRASIDKKELELKDLEKPLPVSSLVGLTTDEIAKYVLSPARAKVARTQLAQLREQERVLIEEKSALEKEIQELEILLGKR